MQMSERLLKEFTAAAARLFSPAVVQVTGMTKGMKESW